MISASCSILVDFVPRWRSKIRWPAPRTGTLLHRLAWSEVAAAETAAVLPIDLAGSLWYALFH